MTKKEVKTLSDSDFNARVETPTGVKIQEVLPLFDHKNGNTYIACGTTSGEHSLKCKQMARSIVEDPNISTFSQAVEMVEKTMTKRDIALEIVRLIMRLG